MVGRHAGDAAGGQAVVAADQHRHAPGAQDAPHGARHLAARGADGTQETRPRRAGIGGLGARAIDVAQILDVLEPRVVQRLVQARETHRRRTHVRSPPSGAQVQAHARDGDGRPLQGLALTYFRSVCGPTSAAKTLPSASAVMPEAPEMRFTSASARSGSGMKARSEPSRALPTVMPRT